MVKRNKYLTEAKTIDDEYASEWKDIPREEFDKIIQMDPATNIANNRIGPSAKQLLLPKYFNGEKDFINKPEEVKAAIETFTKNRGSYPQTLRNIANFPSVKDFVEYITLGDESDFAKNFDLADIEAEKEVKESPIDRLYNKYYSKIDREVFDKIIKLDPETTDQGIGKIAKNLLLPKYLAGENVLAYGEEKVKDACLYFNRDKDTYPEESKKIENYRTVIDFINYVLEGPKSQFIDALENNPRLSERDWKYIGSTRTYDIVQPLSWRGNNAITCMNKVKSHGNEVHTWCTGWSDDRSQWHSHSSDEYIYCFINKQKPEDRKINFQLSIKQSSHKVGQFLDGDDRAFGEFNAGDKLSRDFFKQFLSQNIDVLKLISTMEPFKSCPTVIETLIILKYGDKPFILKTSDDLKELNIDGIKQVIKEAIISIDTIPFKAFAQAPALTKVTFEEGVKVIGIEAFLGCTGLNNIQFPSTLVEIKEEAFANCSGLKNTIKVPNSLVKIGREAFRSTHCTLSIDKNRKEPLHLSKADFDWFIHHSKGITVKESMENNNINTEELIPFYIQQEDEEPEFLGFYKNYDDVINQAVDNGWSYEIREMTIIDEITKDMLPDFEDDDSYDELVDYFNKHESLTEDILDENIPRDLAKAYANSTKAERGIQNHPDSRHDELRYSNSTRKYVKWDYAKSNYRELTKEEALQMINSNRNELENIRFIIDGKVIEYEIRSGNRLYQSYWMYIPYDILHANNVIIRDKNGQETNDSRYAIRYGDIESIIKMSDKIYYTDEYQHPITSDQLAKRRSRSEIQPVEYKKLRSKDDPSFVPHRPTRNVIGNEVMIPFDTGSHALGSIFKGWSIAINNYVSLLKRKKELYREFDYVRRAIKKHESERDQFEEAEYNEILQELNESKVRIYNDYQQVNLDLKKQKDKLILNYDTITKEYNNKLINSLGEIERANERIFNLKNNISDIQLKDVQDSAELKRLNSQIESTQAELKKQKEKEEQLKQQLAEIQKQIEENETDLVTSGQRLNELTSSVDEVAEKAVKDKFKKIDELSKQLETIQAEHSAKYKSTVKKQNDAKKELAPELKDIVVFDDDEEEPPEETLETEINQDEFDELLREI